MFRDFLKFSIFRESTLKTVPICQFASKIQKKNFGHMKLVNEQQKKIF